MNRRKSEPDGHVHIQLFLMLFAICFVIAVLVPVTQRRSLKTDTPECFTNLHALRVAYDVIGDPPPATMDFKTFSPLLKRSGLSLECPVSKTGYEFHRLDGGWAACCPDPDNHLGLGEKTSCVSLDGSPHADPPPAGLPEDRWWSITQNDAGDLVMERQIGWVSYLFTGIGLFVLFSIGKLMVFALIEPEWKNGSFQPRKIVTMGQALWALILLLVFSVPALLVMAIGFSPKVWITKEGGVEMVNRFIKIPYLRRSLRARDVIAVGTDSKSSDVLLHTTWKGKIRTWKIKLADEEVVPALAATIRSRIFGPAPPPR